jgi:hypothetical protein
MKRYAIAYPVSNYSLAECETTHLERFKVPQVWVSSKLHLLVYLSRRVIKLITRSKSIQYQAILGLNGPVTLKSPSGVPPFIRVVTAFPDGSPIAQAAH